ncbi:MAG: hypothetical protein KAW83_03315 [Dehalococcoidia bacterium]|nr:hypothetical protein [Dehalococcoidia bacterium]
MVRKLIVSCGQGPEDIGIMVTTPGSNIINMLEMKPGPSSDEMATALTTLLHEEQNVKRQKGGGIE